MLRLQWSLQCCTFGFLESLVESLWGVVGLECEGKEKENVVPY